jgi:hypothetical protein
VRVAAVLMLLAACGDNLAIPMPEARPPHLTCWADVWQTDHTVSAVAAMNCHETIQPRKVALQLSLGGEVAGWRMHWVDCYSTIIDTYDMAEMPPGTAATSLVEDADGVECKTGEIQLLRQ